VSTEASALNAFATYALLEGVAMDFFVPLGESANDLYLASMRSMGVFEGFSMYVVEGRGCAVATAKQYGRVVRRRITLTNRSACVAYGYKWARLDLLHQSLAREYPREKRIRDPILVEDLIKIRRKLDMSVHTWRMYWALLTVTFFGVSRTGDHVPKTRGGFDPKRHSTRQDLRLTGGEMTIRMEEHKTHKAGGGFDEKPFVAAAGAQTALCPVRAMEAYVREVGRPMGIREPLFQHRDGTPVTGPDFLKFVRRALAKVGRDPKRYGTHSARIGGATLALTCHSGSEFALKALGFWMGESALLYTRPTKSHMARLMQEMLAKSST
jgi:hypothetical protein